MTPPPRLSVVVGVQHATTNLAGLLRALRIEAHEDVEFVFCHTSADPDVPSLVGTTENSRAILSAPGSLIPHMWRDGILAARGAYVATTTAHCIPAADWVDVLLSACQGDDVLGGTIDNAPDADAVGDAIFLLRYARFAPPQVRRAVADVAADNALYPRAALLQHGDLLTCGFWEPSFHHRFRDAGMALVVDPRLGVIHRNQYRPGEFIRQRLAHGHEFGVTRATARSPGQRLLLLMVSPAVLPLALARITMAAARNRALRPRLVHAWFWLPVFAAAWTTGEALGYADSLKRRKFPSVEA